MTLKTILALVLCSFLASLPHAEGISCYSCLEYPGSNQTCSNPAIIQCGPYYDSCVAMNYTSNIMGIHYSAALKNCSISNHQCNSSYVCGLVNSSISQSGGTLLSCSFNCCYGDLCNGQGGGGNVTLPPWTNPPPTTYHPPFTTQSPSGCGAAVNNTLKSPGYPSRYPNNMDCVYRVHIPHGMAMRINFSSFLLESGFDYLTIKNENNQNFGRYTGGQSGQIVDVTGRYAVFSFHSDGSVGYRGFLLRFFFYRNATNPPPTTYHPPLTTQNPSGCGAAVNNTLKSPGYPSRYPNNMDCVYRVQIPHGMAMRINFSYFLLESGFDYLTIKNENNQSFGRYTGGQSGQIVDVTGRYAVLSFHSDGSVGYRGFLLRFLFYRNATNPPPTTYYPPLTTQNPSGCGGVVNNVLKSPRYPLNYPNNMDCNYWVLIPLGYVLNISFSSFVLENSWTCRYDYLKITNEHNQTVAKYCGVKTGRNVYVTGRFAVISFHSDGSGAFSGYLLNFSYIRNATNPPPTTYHPPLTTQNPSGCGAAVNNTLKSPGYPSRYPNNMDCVYRVQIPHGMAMRINFSYFLLESGYDYLMIKNENNQSFGRYTGGQSGQIVHVTGRYAVLSFKSDGSVGYRGYLLRFFFYRNATNPPPTTYYPPLTTQNPSGCGGVVNNVLKSPRYPLNYPNNMDCNYWVLIPLGYVLNISFSSFVLENSWTCRYDYLKITNEHNQTVAKYCGVKTGRNVYVTGRFAVISFHSDGSGAFSGYLLNFSYISNSTSAPPSFTTSYPPYPTVYPTGIPMATARPTFGTPGPSPQSRLRYYINVFRALLDQMEYIVDNDLSGNISVREHKDLVRKAIYNVDAAMKSFGRQKRDVMKTKMVDQLKKKANELLSKMENKKSLIKKRSLKKLQEKREAKKQMKKRQLIMKNTMDIVSKSFGKIARNKQ
ncbi:unnamed protein product [Porites lobata]|uniref:CUB domain-containing protein n=1 Tax=Porites lobata TaxID=104759 RepID=A0ABN8RIV9_9CNID|nr:unnamed protein product [Porites lobata]